jgi:hypothetical protein
MKKRLFVTILCCFTLVFFLACRANAERPFTEVTFGMTRDEVEAVEPDFANLTQLEKSRYNWSCNRTFSGEVGYWVAASLKTRLTESRGWQNLLRRIAGFV